jgi:hypothetical protein
MKLAWNLLYAFGGLAIAYHAWVLIPVEEIIWRTLISGYCVAGTMAGFFERLEA